MMRIVAVFLCLLLGAPASGGMAQVRLNEILADPVLDWDGDGEVGSRPDEWVEIVNVGSSAVDLSGYRLGDVSGGTAWRFGFAGALAPGEVRVVYGSDAVVWQGANGFPSFGLSLNNAGDTVFLFDVSGGDTVVVDQHTYAAAHVQDDRAIGRLPDGADNWVVFDELNPYAGDPPPEATGCAPTPGAPNACDAVLPVERSTWGAIKDLFK